MLLLLPAIYIWILYRCIKLLSCRSSHITTGPELIYIRYKNDVYTLQREQNNFRPHLSAGRTTAVEVEVDHTLHFVHCVGQQTSQSFVEGPRQLLITIEIRETWMAKYACCRLCQRPPPTVRSQFPRKTTVFTGIHNWYRNYGIIMT